MLYFDIIVLCFYILYANLKKNRFHIIVYILLL